MKSDKLSVNSLAFLCQVQMSDFVSVLPLNQWKAVWKKRRKNTMLEMSFMPQTYSCAAHKAANLVFSVWPWTVMNPASTQRSPSSPKVAPWFASPGLSCQMKGMLTARVDGGALWDVSSPPGSQGWLWEVPFHQQTALFPSNVADAPIIQNQLSCQSSSSYRWQLCVLRHVGAWGKIALAQCSTLNRGAQFLQQGWRRSSGCLQSLP